MVASIQTILLYESGVCVWAFGHVEEQTCTHCLCQWRIAAGNIFNDSTLTRYFTHHYYTHTPVQYCSSSSVEYPSNCWRSGMGLLMERIIVKWQRQRPHPSCTFSPLCRILWTIWSLLCVVNGAYEHNLSQTHSSFREESKSDLISSLSYALNGTEYLSVHIFQSRR